MNTLTDFDEEFWFSDCIPASFSQVRGRRVGRSVFNYVSVYKIEGEKYFPSFFLDSRYGRAELEAVSKALRDLPGTTKLHFLE